MRVALPRLAFAVALVSAAVSAEASAAAQDFQVGSRAKGMGGSYTAFGDDPVAVWINPAGTAGQNSQFAISYQSFTQYEFNRIQDQISPDLRHERRSALIRAGAPRSEKRIVPSATDAAPAETSSSA